MPAHLHRFGANSCDLAAIADWLKACGVTTVALESTGVYRAPLFELLEARGCTVWLAEPGQVSRCGARLKIDVLDTQWRPCAPPSGRCRPATPPATPSTCRRRWSRGIGGATRRPRA